MSTSKQTGFPSDEADKFVVRFPGGMRDGIAEAAKAAGRSMNAEIVQRLTSWEEMRRQLADSREQLHKLAGELTHEREHRHERLKTELTLALKQRDAEAKHHARQAREREESGRHRWLPSSVSERLVSAAKEAGRSIEAEMASRLERSIEDGALTQVLARLERDLAASEQGSMLEEVRSWTLAETLKWALQQLPDGLIVESPAEGLTVEKWRELAAAMARHTKGVWKRKDEVLNRLRLAEEKLRVVSPSSVDSGKAVDMLVHGILIDRSDDLADEWPSVASSGDAAKPTLSPTAWSEDLQSVIAAAERALAETQDQGVSRIELIRQIKLALASEGLTSSMTKRLTALQARLQGQEEGAPEERDLRLKLAHQEGVRDPLDQLIQAASTELREKQMTTAQRVELLNQLQIAMEKADLDQSESDNLNLLLMQFGQLTAPVLDGGLSYSKKTRPKR